MKFRGSGGEAEKIEPQMAPMIDVVFQLLIFFMLTLKIIEPEVDFPINMPQGKPSADPKDVSIAPYQVQLIANADGTLRQLQFGGQARAPHPETSASEIDTYIKLHEGEKLTQQEAARRIGEDRLFQQLNKAVADFVREQRREITDKKKLEKELKAKIGFDYKIDYRYLTKAVSACRGRMVTADGEQRREELIKNVEFVRPGSPKAGDGS